MPQVGARIILGDVAANSLINPAEIPLEARVGQVHPPVQSVDLHGAPTGSAPHNRRCPGSRTNGGEDVIGLRNPQHVPRLVDGQFAAYPPRDLAREFLLPDRPTNPILAETALGFGRRLCRQAHQPTCWACRRKSSYCALLHHAPQRLLRAVGNAHSQVMCSAMHRRAQRCASNGLFLVRTESTSVVNSSKAKRISAPRPLDLHAQRVKRCSEPSIMLWKSTPILIHNAALLLAGAHILRAQARRVHGQTF